MILENLMRTKFELVTIKEKGKEVVAIVANQDTSKN